MIYRGMAAVRAKKLDQVLVELHELDKAYRNQKIVFFKPLTAAPQYEQFFEDQCMTVRLVLGANRSSKTVTGVMEAIAHSLGYRPWLPYSHPLRIVRLANGHAIPVPNIGRVLAQNYEQAIRQTIMEKFNEWAPKHLIKRIDTNTRGIPVGIEWLNGSKIYFMSNDQDDMSFEGPAGHWFWVDEPCDRAKYIGLKRGLVDHNGHCWITMTPLSQAWINDEIVARAGDPGSGVQMYKFSIWDNCKDVGGYLDRAAIESFLGDQNEEELEARLHANFLHLAGRVYKKWEPRAPFWVEPFDIPLSWPRIMLCDPHSNKPLALMWAAISPSNRIFVYRAMYSPDLKTIRDASKYIKEVEGWESPTRPGQSAEKIAHRIIDWSAQGAERSNDTAGMSVRRKFHENGITFALAKKADAAYGYDSIHEALKINNEWSEPGLVVFNTCRQVKQNFLNFCRDDWSNRRQAELKDPKETYRKKFDDFIDLIRYIYQSGLSYRSLKHMAEQAEEKFYEDVTPHNGAVYQMPGLQTGYARRVG